MRKLFIAAAITVAMLIAIIVLLPYGWDYIVAFAIIVVAAVFADARIVPRLYTSGPVPRIFIGS